LPAKAAARLLRGFQPNDSQPIPTNMLAPEVRSQIEEIKKRAGQLWRYL
jgi:hypothetical protein